MTIDLQRFCANEHDLRSYLHKPWAHKGYTYASNGHICIRVPAPDQAETVFPHKVGDAAASIFERPAGAEYAPLPEFAPAPDCGTCEGRGKVKMEPCADCDGDGYFEHGHHEYHCKECDGEGSIYGVGDMQDCPDCCGSGRQARFVRFIPGVGYDSRYLAWIAALPGAKFAIGAAAKYGEHQGAGRFTFDGGEGVLMPMSDRGEA